MVSVLAVATATVVGLMVGVEIAVAFVINPILLRLPAGPSLEGRADGARMLGRAMPFWYFGSLLLTIALAVADRAGTSAAAAAAILLAISVAMSIALLVPINNRSAQWTADDHPADWREQQRRWDRLHYARVAIIVAAYVLVLVAATR
ncbi:DUF1772 domain-containing protein [Tsukamurella sp. 8F]|uniref:DUF1772 domain-containing protein n=1 Tax=unclassified Tsukamurella TaxID=2633480 RepID=UPI0023BA22CC|nr:MULTISPECIES: DUF1772 domain-containing protein [unclassified Tsukamurella]MDF0530386.1 DUF1772 domain-containing protein [Tsukamurella sp. 8J]MDF0587683.1 DUF1772 domain-containing protein [Tsukamurella sp. 8F]